MAPSRYGGAVTPASTKMERSPEQPSVKAVGTKRKELVAESRRRPAPWADRFATLNVLFGIDGAGRHGCTNAGWRQMRAPITDLTRPPGTSSDRLGLLQRTAL